MRTTGLFTTHRVELEAKMGRPFKLIPFGDVHRDSDHHAHDVWLDFLNYAKKQKNAVFLGMGDFTDGVSTSERIVLNDSGLHDTTKTTMKNVYRGVTKTLYNELSFMRGRCLGLLGGNHYFDFGDGNTTDHVLAASLGTKFLGVCSLIRISLRFPDRGQTRAHLDIFAHHGKGGGTLPGSTFNTLEKMTSVADADFYFMGHDHGKGCIPSSPRLKLISSGPKAELQVRQRQPWLGRTGSFMTAYEPGMKGYNVDAGRASRPLGWIEFEITPKRNRALGSDVVEFSIRGTS